MSAAAVKTRQGLVQLWLVQIAGTLVLAAVVLAFARNANLQLGTLPEEWKRWMIVVILATGGPALLYLRHYKRLLLQDLQLERRNGGQPDPQARTVLVKALVLGGALCELPMAAGVVQLFFGGETRWFVGATMVAIALRLSYRPFTGTKLGP